VGVFYPPNAPLRQPWPCAVCFADTAFAAASAKNECDRPRCPHERQTIFAASAHSGQYGPSRINALRAMLARCASKVRRPLRTSLRRLGCLRAGDESRASNGFPKLSSLARLRSVRCGTFGSPSVGASLTGSPHALRLLVSIDLQSEAFANSFALSHHSSGTSPSTS
jgi:hypothetical protein